MSSPRNRVNVAFVEDVESGWEFDERLSDGIYFSEEYENKDGDKDEVAIKESHEFPFRSKGKQNGAHYTLSRDCTAGREAHCTALLAELATRNLRQSSLRHEDLRTLPTRGISLRDSFGPAQDTLGMEAATRGWIEGSHTNVFPNVPKYILGEKFITVPNGSASPIREVGVPEMADMNILSNFDLNNAQPSSSLHVGYDSDQDEDDNTARERTRLDSIQPRRSYRGQADIHQMSPPLMRNRRQTEGKNDHMEVSQQRAMLRPKAEGAFAKDQPPRFKKQSSGI